MHLRRFASARILATFAAFVVLVPASSALALQHGRIFSAPSYLLGPPSESFIAFGDLNFDGRPDLVAGSASVPGFSVAFGLGGGEFTPFQPALASFPQVSVAGVADFDGDGRPDVAGISTNAFHLPASVVVAYGDGHGAWADSFAVAARFLYTFPPVDLNGDGRADLIVSSPDSDSVAVYLGNANRTLTFAGAYRTAGLTFCIVAGEVTGGGGLDLVVGNEDAPLLSVFPGNGDGTFGPRADYPIPYYPNQFVLGAFDGVPGDDIAGGSLEFFGSATGAGGFGPLSALPQGANVDGFAAADLNHDGHLDLIGASYPNGLNRAAYTWLGDGAGGFGPRIDSHFGVYNAIYPVLADVDGDGNPDLALESAVTAGRILIATGRGDGSFGATNSPPVINGTFRGLAVADFDGDGRPDAVASDDDLKLAFAHGHGDGTFDPFVESASVGAQFNQLFAGRFDGDANQDLIGIVTSPPTLSYLKGHGDGTFDAPVNFALGTAPGLPAFVDLDGDGRTDVAVPCAGADVLDILMGGAGGPLAPVTSATPAGPVAVRFRDLDGDGKLDRVLACTGQVVVQLGDGLGAWTTVQSHAQTPSPADVELADLDEDGIPEVLFPEQVVISAPYNPVVHILKGLAGGMFGTESVVSLDWLQSTGPFVSRTTIGKLDVLDLDGDGHLDLLANDLNGQAGVVAARGHGDGSFDYPQAYESYYASPHAIGIADLDGDGRPDVVQTGRNRLADPTSFQSTVAVFLNRTHGVTGVPPGSPPRGGAPALTIASVAPNPSRGRVSIALTAATAGTARLALYAPSGREVYAREGVALTAGPNTVALDTDGRLPAGVYWLRVSVGGAHAARKIVLLGGK